MPLEIIRNDITKMLWTPSSTPRTPRCWAAGAWTGPSTAPPGRG